MRRSVLLAAGGAPWEAAALRALEGAGVVVLKRCVDLHDLLASGGAGQAEVAVVSAELPGLDADAVTRLLRHDVRTLAVGDPAEADRLSRIGVVGTVDADDSAAMSGLADAVDAAAAATLVADPEPDPLEPLPASGPRGRVVAVWGPAGAPGRTTVAVALAAEHAAAGGSSVLVDADPYGGAVAQHLGVLDEMSGLLAAARLVNDGSLDTASYASLRRRVADRFDVLTGLPRPDRWIEARPGVVERVLELSAEVGDVVVDCGFCVEEDLDGRSLGRNAMTLAALGEADAVVLVGSAEPTGLTRLARALVDLAEVAPACPTYVVVNRMRDSLGWRRRDISGMVEGYARGAPVHFLPEDRATLDRALVAGRSPTELGDSAFRKAVQALAQAVLQLPKSR